MEEEVNDVANDPTAQARILSEKARTRAADETIKTLKQLLKYNLDTEKQLEDALNAQIDRNK